MEPLIPLDDILDDDVSFVLVKDGNCNNNYQAFMASTPGHPVIKDLILNCVQNCSNNYYGKDQLDITGPGLFGKAILNYYDLKEISYNNVKLKLKDDICLFLYHRPPGKVFSGDKLIIKTETNKKYNKERNHDTPPHYDILYKNRKVFFKNIDFSDNINTLNNVDEQSNKIPKIIYQTCETKYVTANMYDALHSWKKKNEDFEYLYFTDKDRRDYIKKFSNDDILKCYDALIPGAFKADLWRCFLMYFHGGVYADADMICKSQLSSVIKYDDENIDGYFLVNNEIISSSSS